MKNKSPPKLERNPFGIHWFRRDLRLLHNPGLRLNGETLKKSGRLDATHESTLPILGIFFLDQAFLDRPDFSANRFQFFLETLRALKRDFVAQGGDFYVLPQGPDAGWKWLLTDVLPEPPAIVTWNRDYEPFARERDTRVLHYLEQSRGITVKTTRDHLLLEPHECLKDDGTPYQVFTPFSRRWMDVFSRPEIQARLQRGNALPALRGFLSDRARKKLAGHDCLDSTLAQNLERISVAIPPAGVQAAWKALREFKAKRLPAYERDRDIPALKGTSHLAIYFKNGSLTVAQAIADIGLNQKSKASEKKFLTELIWREFYYHLLWHQPSVENQAFQPKTRGIVWPGAGSEAKSLAWFRAWQEGRTGYPIVDAGMRQLVKTGWMHNRVRMIVASFLTKDLLLDWRWGERHFMNMLLDGDLAPNNGGWQWAASTGCDAQPYFRIFNPWSQSKRFDPDAEYIKRWIPELKSVPASVIHDEKKLNLWGADYPAPIVDHATQAKKAIALFKNPPKL